MMSMLWNLTTNREKPQILMPAIQSVIIDIDLSNRKMIDKSTTMGIID